MLPITLLLAGAFALSPQAENLPLTGSLALPKTVHAGSLITVGVKLHFGDGLHGYQNPPSDEYEIPVKVSVVSGAKLVAAKYPKGTDLKVGTAPAVKVYSGDITVNLSLKAPQKSGPLVVSVSYQQCNDAACFPPASLTLKSSLTVVK